MFWNKNKQTTELENWAARLEAGEQNEQTLAMAAQLRTINLHATIVNPGFKARLRRRLVVIHSEELPLAEATAGQRLQPLRWREWRWPLFLLTLLLLLAYWQRAWLLGLFDQRVDDWRYTDLGSLLDIALVGNSQGWSGINSLIAINLLSFGAIFGLCLLYLLVRRLYTGWQPQRAPRYYWSQIAYKGMWLSGMMSVLMIGFIVYGYGQQGTNISFLSTSGSSQNLARRSAPVFQPSSGTSAESAALAPADAAPLALADQPAAAAPQVETYALAPRLDTAAVLPFKADNLGFAVGGAKDINNFRENITQGYLPLATDVTVEGLFYDYYFATGQNAPCIQLFCPSYAQATSRDPISGEAQHFLAVGLNSGLSARDFARKRLNLVVVLDISGSMAEEFTRYAYDNSSTNSPLAWEAKPKLTAATEAIAALLDQLAPEDQLAIVLFDDQAHLAKAMRLVGETDMASIKQHILALREQGGTNMEAGYRMGTDLLAPFVNADPALYENRLIFLTDAQPNTGATSEAALLALTQANAAQRIYTTFIGIGVDFNTQLIEGLTKIRGANYYAVHSPADFIRRVQDEFNFMVTPLLFDLTLTFNSPDFVIEQVYGSPEADQASGEIMRINTLFPSASSNGEVKGGLVLLQLRPRNGTSANGGQATVTVTYADRSGQVQSSAATVALPATANGQGGDHYDNLGIRKGILLVRYANLLRNWINDTRGRATGDDEWLYPNITPETGIQLPRTTHLGEWERQSLPLQVSPQYRALFAQFKGYFGAELNALEDPTLQQELTILEWLTTQP